MKNYHDEVVQILTSEHCTRLDHIGEGTWKWTSPKTSAAFNVDAHIGSKKIANEVLARAGIAAIIK